MNAVWIAVVAISLLGLIFGLILGYASRRFAVEDDPVVEKIDALLPQSQCGQCGYPGCRPYAEAVGTQGEKINCCAPGGEAVMLKIAELLNVDPQPTDGDAQEAEPAQMLAVIDEANCIGCTKCIQACPVDAIVGATLAGPARRGEVLTDVRLLGPRLAESAAGPDARIVPIPLADAALMDLVRPGDVVDIVAAPADDAEEARLERLHREMQPAMQIFLRYADIATGDYA